MKNEDIFRGKRTLSGKEKRVVIKTLGRGGIHKKGEGRRMGWIEKEKKGRNIDIIQRNYRDSKHNFQ